MDDLLPLGLLFLNVKSATDNLHVAVLGTNICLYCNLLPSLWNFRLEKLSYLRRNSQNFTRAWSLLILLTSGKHVREMYTPSNPTFIYKLVFSGIYLFLLALIQNIDCGYLL